MIDGARKMSKEGGGARGVKNKGKGGKELGIEGMKG